MFLSGVLVNKISPCGVPVISNHLVGDICVPESTVYGELILFEVLWFLM